MAGLEEFAERLSPAGRWKALALPASDCQRLRELANRVKHRPEAAAGVRESAGRTPGVSALFTGPSGTGKTLAAGVIANELGLALYRIDLSTLVSKYIGETEKNLARIFDAADDLGAVLLIDEADALFGKRSEVKDSHDRYANLEVAYLLQRMETYRGVVILTTSLPCSALDAFARRFSCVVEFPSPAGDQQPGARSRRRVRE